MSPNVEFSRGKRSFSNRRVKNKAFESKELLGIHIDYKVKSNTGVDSIYKKIQRKLIAVSRITNYMELPKRRILMSAFFSSSI